VKYCTHALRALSGYGGYASLIGYLGGRAAARLKHRFDSLVAKLAAGAEFPWPNFERRDEPRRPDKISPAEVGILWWSYDLARDWMADHGFPVDVRLQAILDAASEFLFDCYFVDETTGELGFPYYVTEKWDHPRKDSGGDHFGYLGAINYQPQNAREEAKMRLLLEFGDTLDTRWRQ